MKKILREIIAEEDSIVMRNEQYDCEQVVFMDGEFFFDYFSPRENITYDQHKISVSQAWSYAINSIPAKLNSVLKNTVNAEGKSDHPGN